MIRFNDILSENPGLGLPTQFRLGRPLGQTTLCFQNFYEQVFPGENTPVDLYVASFLESGEQVEGVRIPVGTGEAVQYVPTAANELGSGLIAAMAVPSFDLAAAGRGKIKLRAQIGTGFYAIWDDGNGHIDTMHEWMAVERRTSKGSSYYFVLDSDRSRIVRRGMVLINPRFGVACDCQPMVSIYDASRRVLGEARAPATAPMGARLIYFDELFSELNLWLEKNGPLGVCVSGSNLVEPLTVEIHQSGDLHIHHIN